MSNTLPKPTKREPGNVNTFTFKFTTKKNKDGHHERIGLQMGFKGQKSLIEGDVITPMGFTILAGSLADSIVGLARIAKEQGLDAVKLIADAGKRMGMVFPPVEEEKPKEQAKIIGIKKPKIIGV